MRRGIIAHPHYIDESNIDELRDMTFVFLTIDAGPAKKLIVEKLEEYGLPFIDTGMGVYRAGDALGGIVTLSLLALSHDTCR